MKVILRALLGVCLVGIIAVAGVTMFANDEDGALSDLKLDAINAAVDASGVKDTIQEELSANLNEIASATGLSISQTEEIVDSLDITSWTVTDLPADAEEATSFSTSASGVDATIILYDDPSYVTVETYGQELTFELPESAQDYASLFTLLS